MRKILYTILSLLCCVSAYAQSTSAEARTLVVKTTNGNVAKFNLEDIEELTFSSDPADDQVSVSILNLSPEFINVTGLDESQTLTAGDRAVLILSTGVILSPAFEDYHFQHIHVHVNDQVIVPEVPADYTPSTEIKVPFTVPEGECRIVVCYSIQQQTIDSGYTMMLEPNPSVELYGVSPDGHYKYFDAYLLADEAYVITGVEFKMGDGPWTDVTTVEGCSFYPDYEVPNLYHICIRPDYQNVTGDVLLRVNGEQHQRYGITWINADEKYIDLDRSILPEKSIDGETVTATLYVNEDYYLNGASASDGTQVNVISGAYVQFTMPAVNVDVTLDFREKIPVSYVPSDHVKEAKIYNAPDIYYGWEVSVGVPGKDIYVIAKAEEGYKPMTATTDFGETFTFTHYGSDMYVCALAIPEDAASMSFTVSCDKAWIVTSRQDVAFGQGNLYAEGETVRFSMYVPAGKAISGVTATTASGESIDLTLDLPYGSFTMPADDVEVAVAYEDLASGGSISVIAYYDEDQYRVFSSTNYDWDFAEGFSMDKGATFYLTVYDDYGENFYVGVKIGDTVNVYPADEDEDTGEYLFGKALVADGDVVIKVGPTQSSVSF